MRFHDNRKHGYVGDAVYKDLREFSKSTLLAEVKKAVRARMTRQPVNAHAIMDIILPDAELEACKTDIERNVGNEVRISEAIGAAVGELPNGNAEFVLAYNTLWVRVKMTSNLPVYTARVCSFIATPTEDNIL